MGFFIGKILIALALIGMAYLLYAFLSKQKDEVADEKESTDSNDWKDF